MSPGAFLDIAEGRTLRFAGVPGGASFGLEEFLDRSRTRYRRPDGACAPGTISTRGAALCFDDPSTVETVCGWMFAEGGQILARSARLGAGAVVEVADVSDEPVTCEDAPSA